MDGRGRKASRRRSAAKRPRRSPLTAFVVAFSLFVQLFAVATPPSLAAPAFAGADETAIAAELKALFGNSAELCAHINDHGAPGKHGPCGNCCDQCPLCRGVLQTMAFVAARPAGPAGTGRQRGARHSRAPWR